MESCSCKKYHRKRSKTIKEIIAEEKHVFNPKKLKIRNVMTNSAYAGMKKEELENNNELVFFLALFIADNYHLLSVDNRFSDLNHRLLVRYLWGNYYRFHLTST